MISLVSGFVIVDERTDGWMGASSHSSSLTSWICCELFCLWGAKPNAMGLNVCTDTDVY